MLPELSEPLLVLLPLVLLLAVAEAEVDGLNSIQGTATCLPEELLLERLDEVVLVLSDEPEDVPLGFELVPPSALLDELLPEEVPLGVVAAPELLLEFSERIAKSIRPEFGLMIVSLMVPMVSPEDPVTLAPIS